jgi:hypothetical protein
MSQVMCDEHGFLRGFSYHDGFFEGVLITDREVHFAIRSVSGERRALTLSGVKGLSIEGIREGNVILNLRALSISQVLRDAELSRLLSRHFSAAPANLGSGATVFWLEASYGAEVVAVCERVDVSESGWGLNVCRVEDFNRESP